MKWSRKHSVALPVHPGKNGAAPVMGIALTGRGLAKIIKRLVETIGLDPKYYAGHSMRAGFVTEMFKAGASAEEVQHVTRHRNVGSLGRYFRPKKARNHTNRLLGELTEEP